jgi:DNA-binding CsgD family transcriptional regulator
MEELQCPSEAFVTGQIILSKRQEECLLLVAEGKTSKQIGRILKLSPSTVDNHIQAAMERLEASCRAEAVELFSYYKQSLDQTPVEKQSVFSTQADDTKMFKSGPPINKRIFQKIPLGGKRNTSSPRERFIAMLQVAMLATLLFAAVTLTIGGIVHLAQVTPRAIK